MNMALIKYHKDGMFRKIGTKKLSKKLGIEIQSLGWGMFSITIDLKGTCKVFNSTKDRLEDDSIEIIKNYRLNLEVTG
jgi:hypothetical protein